MLWTDYLGRAANCPHPKMGTWGGRKKVRNIIFFTKYTPYENQILKLVSCNSLIRGAFTSRTSHFIQCMHFSESKLHDFNLFGFNFIFCSKLIKLICWFYNRLAMNWTVVIFSAKTYSWESIENRFLCENLPTEAIETDKQAAPSIVSSEMCNKHDGLFCKQKFYQSILRLAT